jgi:N-acetylglucosaminyldiphosphoundecaprenol N-acetyl-beta-D-mannosaminyltransferase
MQGIRVRDNLNGTDLVPRFFAATSGRGWRYYLLGNDPSSIERAAASARERFPGWVQAGFHHGYLRPEDGPAAVERINQARPDLLLVGMGNPRQERWIHDHRASLRVPLCIGVGGLFDYWAGNIRRTAPWVRRLGMEWLGLLAQQPHKLRRYGVGNPKFLLRATRQALGRRAGA